MNVIGIIVFIIGIAFFTPMSSVSSKRNRCSSYISGRIVSVDTCVKRRRLRRAIYYIPTVMFEVNGISYKVKYIRSPDAEEYHIGDSFWVMYNPRNPYEITQEDELLLFKSGITAFFGTWIIVLSFIIMMV